MPLPDLIEAVATVHRAPSMIMPRRQRPPRAEVARRTAAHCVQLREGFFRGEGRGAGTSVDRLRSRHIVEARPAQGERGNLFSSSTAAVAVGSP
jgi:hypothetical protein